MVVLAGTLVALAGPTTPAAPAGAATVPAAQSFPTRARPDAWTDAQGRLHAAWITTTSGGAGTAQVHTAIADRITTSTEYADRGTP